MTLFGWKTARKWLRAGSGFIAGATRGDRKTRLVAIGLIAAIVFVFVVAVRLAPDPSGRGTHVQLGLAPCAFLRLTGEPCPTCGMTTAICRLVRGDLRGSLEANPAGVAFALACLGMFPWLVVTAVRGRSWPTRTLRVPLLGVVTVVAALSVMNWTYRRFFGGRHEDPSAVVSSALHRAFNRARDPQSPFDRGMRPANPLLFPSRRGSVHAPAVSDELERQEGRDRRQRLPDGPR